MFNSFNARISLAAIALTTLIQPYTLAAESNVSEDAQALLKASDEIRNPSKPFSLNTTLTEYRKGSQTDSNTLQVYSSAAKTGGQFRTLIRFVAPLRDANKLMLKNGNDLWFYDPGTKSSIRISPQQRLLGQAANGDVVTVNLSKDYKASLEKEEDINDGDKKNRHCYKLILNATSNDVTYHKVHLWIDKQSKQPVKAKYFAESGGLLKTAYYRRYQSQLGVERPTETVIIDGIDSQWVTVLRFSNYAWKDIPEQWLQHEYLSSFKAN